MGKPAHVHAPRDWQHPRCYLCDAEFIGKDKHARDHMLELVTRCASCRAAIDNAITRKERAAVLRELKHRGKLSEWARIIGRSDEPA